MDIRYYRKLKSVDRLSMESKLREYNLLEHQYMVAMLFRHFAYKEDVPYDINTMDLILHHDIAETVTADIPYPVKNYSVRTAECWQTIENEIIRKHESLLRYTDENIRKTMTVKQLELFKVCDLLDLWIFLKEEQDMGNRSKGCSKIIDKCEELINGKFKYVDLYMNSYKHDQL